MSNELQLPPGIAPTGSTVYAMVYDSTGQGWNTTGTPAFGTLTATRGDFDIAMTEISGTGMFRASMVGTAGFRRWQYWLQPGASPSATADILVGSGYGWWSGSALVSFATDSSGADIATASKLLKYVQLLARSDAAITTDNATELTAINASGGSGAGDYAATSDSLEAATDRTSGAGSATLANQVLMLAKINPARIVSSNAVNVAGDVEVHIGDDLSTSDTNRALQWSVTDEDLTSATIQMSYKLTSDYEANTGSWTNIGTGSVTAYASGINTVKVALTAAETAGLTVVTPTADKYAYTYRLRATLSARIRTIKKGGLNVVQ